LKKVMLLAAMLAMVLAAAVPAVAQTQAAAVAQEGTGNVACVQQALNVENNKTQVAVSQYGDAINVNIQAISQTCNITVAQVNTIVAEVTGSASATASATSSATASATSSATASATSSATASAAAAGQYQYSAAAAQYQYTATASAAPELPSTGGSSLIALGAGVLLVAGGLLARRIVR
jgi:LPXTG-motif cell wall-anchored protein